MTILGLNALEIIIIPPYNINMRILVNIVLPVVVAALLSSVSVFSVVGIAAGTTSLRLIKCRGHCPPADTWGASGAVPVVGIASDTSGRSAAVPVVGIASDTWGASGAVPQETAFEQLLQSAGNTVPGEIQPPLPGEPHNNIVYAGQWVPPYNDEPGFEWPKETKNLFTEHFVSIGNFSTFLKIRDAQSSELSDSAEKCSLNPNTKYAALDVPGFYGDHMIVMITEPPAGCTFNKGYVYMEHVSSSSAGGAWQLPRNVRAFIDTIAYAEGTNETYNFIFTFATFKNYDDHPRKVKCVGRLCSDAAGRYQFLSDTWDALAKDLALPDFTPPNQDKAVMELIRRAGAYKTVSNSSNHESFVHALNKLNTIWASLPGSPYGQPTHSTSSLWKFYKQALSKYN